MVFDPVKFKFGRKEVEFAGFHITESGVKPVDSYIQRIMDFTTPTNITDIRSWFGLINQVAYCFSKTEAMAPFRHLLSPNNEFLWTQELEEAFKLSKLKIVELIKDGVYSFDPQLWTCLRPDWSKEGMGWILQQKVCDCRKITLFVVLKDGD